MSGRPATGAGPEPTTCGYLAVGLCRRKRLPCGFGVIGCTERAAGCGSRATGGKIELVGEQSSHSLRFTATGSLMHRGAVVGALFSIARNCYISRSCLLRRFNVLAESPDYM